MIKMPFENVIYNIFKRHFNHLNMLSFYSLYILRSRSGRRRSLGPHLIKTYARCCLYTAVSQDRSCWNWCVICLNWSVHCMRVSVRVCTWTDLIWKPCESTFVKLWNLFPFSEAGTPWNESNKRRVIRICMPVPIINIFFSTCDQRDHFISLQSMHNDLAYRSFTLAIILVPFHFLLQLAVH